jgi:peptidyl-prolyl cis-trans isomerase SurA
MNLFKSILPLVFLAFALPLSAQPKEGESLDKVIAIVGKQIITDSDIKSEIMGLKQTNPSIDTEDPAIRQRILDLLINQKLKVSKAVIDSVDVSNDEIDMRWNQALMSMKQRYGSEQRIADIYGKSISSLRYEYKDQIKNALLAEKLTQMKMSTLEVSPVEVTDFFNEFKDSLQQVPDMPVIRHIVKYLVTDDNTKNEAKQTALKIRDSIIAGADFAEMAELYSQDPGTKTAGGDLGWSKKGSLVPEYEKAAYALMPGEVSQPVESPFGFHVIKVADKRSDEIKTSHILIKIDRSNNSKEETYAFLKSINDSIERGAKFEELAKKYSDDKETKGFGGLVEPQRINYFSMDARQKVQEMEIGDITDPLIYAIDPNKPAYHIIYKEDVKKGHKPTPDTDYTLLEQMAKMKKRQDMMEEWHSELRSELFWKIVDEDYK